MPFIVLCFLIISKIIELKIYFYYSLYKTRSCKSHFVIFILSFHCIPCVVFFISLVNKVVINNIIFSTFHSRYFTCLCHSLPVVPLSIKFINTPKNIIHLEKLTTCIQKHNESLHITVVACPEPYLVVLCACVHNNFMQTFYGNFHD